MRTHKNPDAAAGHYRTVGASLVGFGVGCGCFTTAIALTTTREIGFIDTPAALVICSILIGVGATMFFGANGD